MYNVVLDVTSYYLIMINQFQNDIQYISLRSVHGKKMMI